MNSKISMQGIIAVTLGSLAVGCGAPSTDAEETTEDVVETAQALTGTSSLLFRDTSTMRGSTADWDFQHGKASCAPGEALSGISAVKGDGQGRTALCKQISSTAFTGNVTATLTLAGADQRRASRIGDWAPNSYKLECGHGEYVSGISEDAVSFQGNNKIHALQCAQGSGLTDTDAVCTVRVFAGGDDRGDTASGDWDYGAYKGECAIDEYIAGVSVSPASGGPHSILCCQSPGVAPSMQAGHTFWGTGALREFSTPNAAACSTACLEDASCTGGTFNPDKQYCWLRTGAAAVGDGLVSDYAFTVSTDLRNTYARSLMHAGHTFWGTGALREFSTPNASDCYLACLNDPGACTGGTFNPDKQYCWLRTGVTSIGDGLVSDYAFTPNTGFPGEGDRALAAKFAPQVRFDGAATSFPMSAQKYYDDVVVRSPNDCTAGEEQTTILPDAPTYYQVATCGRQTRITYWWFYGVQHACLTELPFGACLNNDSLNGYHNGDWEHVTVTLSEDASRIAAVTYYQHGGSYTRMAARGGFETTGTHPVIYAGKIAHGSFHEQGGVGGCGYWEDFRNFSNASLHLNTQSHLVSLDGNEEAWMTPDRAGGFSWGYEGVNTHPTTSGPSCSMSTCSGWSTWSDVNTDGCYKSQCEDGDQDTGVECITACRSGYTNTGLLCSMCSGSWDPTTWYCDTYAPQHYGYNYTLPTSDSGLLSPISQ